MKYIKRGAAVLAFFMGLVILLLAASYIFMPKNNMKNFGMEEVAANGILGEKENTIDVLILGDSESYSAISPMQIWKETGYTSYVCGTSAQMLEYSQTLLYRTFERQAPKVVILETNAIYRKITLGTAGIGKLSNYFSIFQYHNRWKSLNWNDLSRSASFTWTDDYKGYQYNVRIEPSQKTEYMEPTQKAAKVPRLNAQYVKAMAEFCEENNAQLILLSTPSTANWNYERHNGIQALADKVGCEYIDLNTMNERVGIDWCRDTRDKGDHMNYFGAVKVSQFLADYLAQKNILTDHRTDSDYAKWNEALKRYELTVGKD